MAAHHYLGALPKIGRTLRYVAIGGNIVFVLWILYNGINEGFKGTRLETLTYIGLVILLLLNVFLVSILPKVT